MMSSMDKKRRAQGVKAEENKGRGGICVWREQCRTQFRWAHTTEVTDSFSRHKSTLRKEKETKPTKLQNEQHHKFIKRAKSRSERPNGILRYGTRKILLSRTSTGEEERNDAPSRGLNRNIVEITFQGSNVKSQSCKLLKEILNSLFYGEDGYAELVAQHLRDCASHG